MNSEEYIVLKRLRDGDPEALDILYLHYAPKVCNFTFHLLRDRTEAEDITHDIFLRIWERRADAGNILSFKNYLFRMTRNAIFNTLKKRQVAVKYRMLTERGAQEAHASETDERISTEDLLEMINLVIQNMPERRRQIFCMSRYDNMSYNDIAEKLAISPKTVQYHISGALAELRKFLCVLFAIL